MQDASSIVSSQLQQQRLQAGPSNNQQNTSGYQQRPFRGNRNRPRAFSGNRGGSGSGFSARNRFQDSSFPEPTEKRGGQQLSGGSVASIQTQFCYAALVHICWANFEGLKLCFHFFFKAVFRLLFILKSQSLS